jgi:hypothetical protein
MEYLLAVAGFVGLAVTTVEIFRNKNGRAVALFFLTVASLTFAGVLWERDRQLRDGRRAAAEVLYSMPHEGELRDASDGELQGIVLATVSFLESRRKQFPDTLDAATSVYADLRAQQARDTVHRCQAHEVKTCPEAVSERSRDRIENTAATMLKLLQAVAGDEYENPSRYF